MAKGNQAERLSPDEERQSWLSAWIDNEAEPPDASWPPSGQDGWQEKWDTYHLIGDVMRTPDLALQPSSAFQQQLNARLAAEPALCAPQRRLGVRGKWMSGLAVAAAVACVTWVASPLLTDRQGSDVGQATMAAVGLPPAPVDLAFTDYLDAHRQLSGAPGAYRMQVSWRDEGARH